MSEFANPGDFCPNAEHADNVKDILLSEFRISRGRIDGLRSYVKNKGGKKRTS